MEDALSRAILEAERGACHVDLDHVTATDPRMLMLGARRQVPP